MKEVPLVQGSAFFRTGGLDDLRKKVLKIFKHSILSYFAIKLCITK